MAFVVQQGGEEEFRPLLSELKEVAVICSDSLLLSLHRCNSYYSIYSKGGKNLSPERSLSDFTSDLQSALSWSKFRASGQKKSFPVKD